MIGFYEPTHQSIADGSEIMVSPDYVCPDGWAWAYNENGDIFAIELHEWLPIGDSVECFACGGDIFIAAIEDGEVIWAHVGEGCDDPTP